MLLMITWHGDIHTISGLQPSQVLLLCIAAVRESVHANLLKHPELRMLYCVVEALP